MTPFFKGWSGQAWCSPENAHKEMDVTLAKEIERLADVQVAPMLEELVKLRVNKLNSDGVFDRCEKLCQENERLKASQSPWAEAHGGEMTQLKTRIAKLEEALIRVIGFSVAFRADQPCWEKHAEDVGRMFAIARTALEKPVDEPTDDGPEPGPDEES